MKRLLLITLMFIAATGANAQYKGSVDFKYKMEPEWHMIGFNFSRVCEQLGVDRQEFATILQREWYNQKHFRLYLLTDDNNGGGDFLTLDGKYADWDSRMWQCEIRHDFIAWNSLDFRGAIRYHLSVSTKK
ncbi:MAG: hypothetical protein II687_05780 [Selenomonadaceae bacterium]|nr:hypothetical protein [Selenomonadaceae bacterium]